jgi:transcriptional regulator of nitric oxide reductase
VVAEKFEAMVQLGTLNSRMKDFFDLWLLSRNFDFDGAELAKQVRATFERRGTRLDPRPVALTSEFTDVAQKTWAAFLKKGSFESIPVRLAEVTDALQYLLHPLAEACASGQPFARRWVAPGPWIG